MVYVPAIQRALPSLPCCKTISHKLLPCLSLHVKCRDFILFSKVWSKKRRGHASLTPSVWPARSFPHTPTRRLRDDVMLPDLSPNWGISPSICTKWLENCQKTDLMEICSSWLIILQKNDCRPANSSRTPARDLDRMTDYVMKTTVLSRPVCTLLALWWKEYSGNTHKIQSVLRAF